MLSILKTLAAFLVILQAGKGAPRKETHQCLKYYEFDKRDVVYYFEVGKRGPCREDQIFLPIPDDLNKTLLQGGALGEVSAFYSREIHYLIILRDYPNLYDQAHHNNSDCQEGYCVWNNPQHPCHGLPANQRYSNETKFCHTLGFQNYCPKNQIFYVQVDESIAPPSTLFGGCDCFPQEQFWFDPNDGNCYAPFSQGSCLESQWLTINQTTGRAKCEPAPCPNDGKHVYWTEGFQKCFLQGETGPCDPDHGETLGLNLGAVECTGPNFDYFPIHAFGDLPLRTGWRDFCKEGSKMSQTSASCWEPRNITTINPCRGGQFSETLQRCVSNISFCDIYKYTNRN